MTKPAPESVRRFVARVEKGLKMIREACDDLDVELRPGPDAEFPPDRPASAEQLKRIASRLESRFLEDHEREFFQNQVDRGLSFTAARELIARVDHGLEVRAERERAAQQLGSPSREVSA